MRLLFLAPRFPYPFHKGDQLTVYRRLLAVHEKHEVTLLSFSDAMNPDGMEHIQSLCRGGVYLVRHGSYAPFFYGALKGIVSSLPLQVLLFQSRQFAQRLIKLLRQEHFDVVHFFMLRMVPYRKHVKNIPCVIDLVDSMSLNIERRIPFEHGIKKWVFQEELRRLIRYERFIGQMFSQMMLTSEKDNAYFDADNITLIPSTISVDEFYPCMEKHDPHRIMFSGNLSYAPNIHAILWFLQNVYPVLLKKQAVFEFVVVGKNPAPQILKAIEGKQQVRVTGYVDSMNDALNRGGVAVAPMQSGSGMQGKILEAMACGLPVVVTSLGKGAIAATETEGLFVEDSPEAFAECLMALMRDRERLEMLGKQARNYIERHHDTAKTDMVLEQIYQKVLLCNNMGG